MASFKLENNVPNYYVDESRDFQLLCRIIDIYLKGCMSRSGYIPYQLDLDKCSEQLLYAIANMQGFTTKKYIPPNILRNILKVFPYCIKRKGTKEAIEVASYAVLSTDRLIYYINVEVNSRELNNSVAFYNVIITCNSQSEYIPYLEELLSFLVPAGWKITYQLLDTLGEEARPIKVAIKSKVARLSGITGKIINLYPLLADAFSEDAAAKGIVKKGVYSRVGFAKILQSSTKEELTNQIGYVRPDYNSGEEINISYTKLIDLNEKSTGQTRFIGNKTFKDNEQQGGE